MRRRIGRVGPWWLVAGAVCTLMLQAEAHSQGRLDRFARPAGPGAAPPPAPPPPAKGPGAPAGGGGMALKGVGHLPPAMDVINTARLAALAAKAQRKCGEQEMAPGVWVRIDCSAYGTVAKAKAHYGARKTALMKAGKLEVLMAPGRVNTARLGKLQLRGPAGRGGAKGGERAGRPGDDEVRSESADDGHFPDVMDLRAQGLTGPVKDQGAVGSCTAFSLSTVMDNLLRQGGKQETTSPLHVWSHYGAPSMGTAYDANIGRSIALYEQWPYSGRTACQMSVEADDECGEAYSVKPNTADNDAKIQREMAAAESSGKHQIVSVERLGPEVNLDEIVSVLASGNALWTAFRIDSDKWRSKAIKNGVIPDWSDWNGGHAVAVVGYRGAAGSRQFLIQNSWSEKWGDRGFAWVSEAMVKKWMYHAYKVRMNVPAPPAKQLTPEDCPGDQVPDLGLNVCADMCPNDVNPFPNNGRCEG